MCVWDTHSRENFLKGPPLDIIRYCEAFDIARMTYDFMHIRLLGKEAFSTASPCPAGIFSRAALWVWVHDVNIDEDSVCAPFWGGGFELQLEPRLMFRPMSMCAVQS